MGELPVRTSTSTPIGPSWPTWPVPMVGVSYPQQMGPWQQCAEGHHAWVPWLRLDNGSFVTWCARDECDHREQWDADSGVAAQEGDTHG